MSPGERALAWEELFVAGPPQTNTQHPTTQPSGQPPSIPCGPSRAKTFGTGEGPFDQFVISYLEEPSLYTCAPYAAAVVECTSAEGYPQFNAPDNACVQHGPSTPSQTSAQLQLFPASGASNADGCEEGTVPLLQGKGPIGTLLPALQQQPAPIVSACTDFAAGVTREDIVAALSRTLY